MPGRKSTAVSARQAASVPATQAPDQLFNVVAAQFGMDVEPFLLALRSTVLPTVKDPHTKQKRAPTQGEVYGFLSVVHTHGLNPFIQEIYAFPKKGGGMQSVVSIDGWLRIINNHPDFDGMEMDWTFQPPVGNKNPLPESCTVIIHSKSRAHPTIVTEWYDECYRGTEPWDNMPKRMLRNRTICQGARVAFGISGIMEADEAETMRDIAVEVVDSSPMAPATSLDELTREMNEAIDRSEKGKAKPKAEPPADLAYVPPKGGQTEPLPAQAPEKAPQPTTDLEPPTGWPVPADPAKAQLFDDSGPGMEDPG